MYAHGAFFSILPVHCLATSVFFFFVINTLLFTDKKKILLRKKCL